MVMCAAILEGRGWLSNRKPLSFSGYLMASGPNPSVDDPRHTPGPIREAWLLDVTGTAQRILAGGSLSRIDAVREVIAAVPPPQTRIEELVLAGMVMELTLGEPRATLATLNEYADRLGGLMRIEPWSVLARRVALRIAERCREQLDVRRLARELRVDETTLRREFRQVFGVTPRDYHLRARVATALQIMEAGDQKISALARSVGYRDERKFFTAVRRLTGRTPGELRALSLAARRSLAAALVVRPAAPPATSRERRGSREAAACRINTGGDLLAWVNRSAGRGLGLTQKKR